MQGQQDFSWLVRINRHDRVSESLLKMDSNESTIVMPIVFRFRWVPFIAAMIAVSVGLLLGQWQTRRALEKESIELKLLTRAAAAPIVLDGRAERLDQIEYRQVS